MLFVNKSRNVKRITVIKNIHVLFVVNLNYSWKHVSTERTKKVKDQSSTMVHCMSVLEICRE